MDFAQPIVPQLTGTSKDQPEIINDEDDNLNLNPEECDEQENNFDKTLKPLEDII